MRGRLHFRIWLSFMVIVAVALPATYWIAHLADPRPSAGDYAKSLAGVLVDDMARLGVDERQARVEKIAAALSTELGVYDDGGRKIAATANAPNLPDKRRPDGAFFHSPAGMGMVFSTDNGFWVTVSHSAGRPHFTRMAVSLGAFAGILFLGAFFLSHRLTRRLERLRDSVAAWDPKAAPARIEVEGRDEVAALARSFNSAARRIAQLLEQQRNMLASASHELRTPLARIMLAAEMMAESWDEKKREASLANIRDDIRELDGLVEEILLAARMEGDEPDGHRMEMVDLLPMARGAAAAYGFGVEGEPANVTGDPGMLRRMMVNLFENAAKHAPENPALVEVGMDGPIAFLKVSDRGPGLTAVEKENVFNPFYRGGRAAGRSGHGLGLSIVRKIAGRHGGQATCRDREGGGAVFEIRLPAAGY